MKHFIYIAIMLSIFACDRYRAVENNIFIHSSMIRSYDTISRGDTGRQKRFDIRLSIVNKSNKEISFWIMSCSWHDNFIVNNDYVYLRGTECDSNFPETIKLKSNDSIVHNGTVIIRNHTWGRTVETTKFGFIYINSDSCKDYQNYLEIIKDRSKQKSIIWSNPLYLNEKK
jgi:hypothetical protein